MDKRNLNVDAEIDFFKKAGGTVWKMAGGNNYIFERNINVQIVAVGVSPEIFSAPISSASSYTNTDAVNSYISIEEGSIPDVPSYIEGRKEECGKQSLSEYQLKVESVIEDLMSSNDQLFIRPWKLDTRDEVRIFGNPVRSVSEVLCESGTRIMLVGKTTFWTPYCNLKDAPVGVELQRYQFTTMEGYELFQCAMYSNMMSIKMGASYLGKLNFCNGPGLDCEEWEVRAMIGEDDCGDQLFRIEKIKRHFEVLLYPEQLKICTIHNHWSPSEFPFLLETKRLMFGVPLPDELNCRKRALLFASSFYIYEKYYQRNKIVRILMGILIVLSLMSIATILVLYKLGHFEPED